MDDTRTLSFDLTDYDVTDYIDRPHIDDDHRNISPAWVVDEVDALADARGFFRGLAIALSGWALVVFVAMLVM